MRIVVQVISEHLVTFKSVDELQKQNQRLLAVVRELSDEKENEERTQISKETQQLQGRLDEALRFVSLSLIPLSLVFVLDMSSIFNRLCVCLYMYVSV